ncbi:DUF7660 family protein [Pleionea sediminis]|uniref:DUF7660 family protein n=1 Tax=Pleionea sediminis TaxID=2569479 RepID=UPI001FE787CF|nr:hypothetical protein [Pleionea sediminis]
MKMEDPFDLLEKVKDKSSFLEFAKALRDERESHEGREPDVFGFSGDWANNDIYGFLEAAIAWADPDFGVAQEPELEQNPWKQFAIFLWCGKTYE